MPVEHKSHWTCDICGKEKTTEARADHNTPGDWAGSWRWFEFKGVRPSNADDTIGLLACNDCAPVPQMKVENQFADLCHRYVECNPSAERVNAIFEELDSKEAQ